MRAFFLVLCVCLIPFAASNAQTNLVTNGNFSQALAPEWIVGNWGGNSSSGITNGVFHLTVTAIGTAAWNVFFYHFQDIILKAGVNYTYSFTSHATAASLISTQVKTVGQPPAAPVWFSDSAVSIGTTDSTFSFTFSPMVDDDSGQINYSLGFGNVPLGATIYIKDVSIVEAASGTVSHKSRAPAAEFVRVNGSGVTVNLVNPANAEMKLYTLQGAQIADYSSMLKSMSAGSHSVNFRNRPISNGTYLLKTGNGIQTQSRPITLVK